MLDQLQVDKIRQRLSQFGVDPFDLSIVLQSGCSHGNNSVDINIDPNTFTSENLGNVVRKAGEKIGDGVQWISQAGSQVYHKLAGKEENRGTSTTEQNNRVMNGRNDEKLETNDVEWIP